MCSRNLELKYVVDNSYWRIASLYKLEDKIPSGYAVQGEIIGGKIQANYEKTPDGRLEFHIFDVYNIEEKRYLTSEERIHFCYKYDLPHIKIKHKAIKIFGQCINVDELREYVRGESIYGAISEGKVFKSTKYPHIHFKCVDPRFLLKGGY